MHLSPGPRGVYAAVSGPEGVALVDHFLPRGGKVSESIQLSGVDGIRKATASSPSSWDIKE